jgi:hypothetical protein
MRPPIMFVNINLPLFVTVQEDGFKSCTTKLVAGFEKVERKQGIKAFEFPGGTLLGLIF